MLNLKIKPNSLYVLILLSFTLTFTNISYSQIYSKWSYSSKVWSQDVTLNLAKLFLVQNIVSVSENEERLVAEAFSASNSGEITAVCYSGDSAKTHGLLLAFYGDYWNENGIVFKGFSFKNMDSNHSIKFLQKIVQVSEDHAKFMEKNFDINNMTFQFDDITIIMFVNGNTRLRLIWNGYDSEWSLTEVRKVLTRMQQFIK